MFPTRGHGGPRFRHGLLGNRLRHRSNYNKRSEFTPPELEEAVGTAHRAVVQANAKTLGLSEVELGLVRALQERYPSPTPVEDCSVWNTEYAEALRPVYRRHSDNLDVVSLFAESLMNLTPWKMCDVITGKPATGADRSPTPKAKPPPITT